MPRKYDDEDDDRPRRRKRRDDEDEDDDRPRSRRGKKDRGNAGPSWVLVAGIGGGVLALLAVAVVAVLVMNNKKGGAADGGGGAPGGNGGIAGILGGGGGGQAGGQAGPPGPGEMTGVIGAVEGMKPPVVKPSADTPGLAFRLPIEAGYEFKYAVLPPQPSDFLALVFVNRQKSAEPMVTVIDRRTARPVGKKIDLLPEYARRPRPSFHATPPDLTADGTLVSTHKRSFFPKWADQPVQVWDAASGKLVKEFPVRSSTLWQGWLSPDRLLSVEKSARLDVWAYPAGTNLGGAGSPADAADRWFSLPLSDPGNVVTPRFAASPDRKKIALPRSEKTPGGERGYYAILDSATGRELSRIPSLLRLAELLDQITFSPDGTRLAYTTAYQDQTGFRHTGLFVVDGTTGAGPPPVKLTDVGTGRGASLVWWGPDMLVAPSAFALHVLNPATGQVLAKLKIRDANEFGAMLPCTTDGRLWVRFESGPEKKYPGTYLCAFDPIPDIRTAGGRTFDLTFDGIRPAAK